MWFVISNNQQQLGPLDERDIAVGLAQGVYNAHTMVWREGWPQWVPLAHSELAKYLPKTVAAVSASTVSTRDRVFGGIGLVLAVMAAVTFVSKKMQLISPAATPMAVQSEQSQGLPRIPTDVAEFDHLMQQRSANQQYFHDPTNSSKTGERLAKDYMAGFFADCPEGLVAFTTSAPQFEGEVAMFTLWQWRELELVGLNASTLSNIEEESEKAEDDLTYGLFHINPDLLDEQSRLNGISDLAGFDDSGAKHAFHRYREFGGSQARWSPWYKSGEHTAPGFSFLAVKHEGKWTTEYQLPISTIEGQTFHTKNAGIAQLSQVVASSKDVAAFLRAERCVTQY